VSVTPATYRKVTLFAAVAVAVIIISGALVRLTGSGLGCPDWPECSRTRFVDVSSAHRAVEQVNRMFTGIVAVAVIVAVLGSLVRRPRRRDLVLLSFGLVLGVVAQIVLGGITVLTDLNPFAVQGHFMLSIAILTDALVLHHRAGESPGPYQATVDTGSRRWVLASWALIGLAVLTGTVVTGTGPHGGDVDVRRFGFAITSVARVHSITVLAATAALLVLAMRIRRGPAWAVLGEPLTALLVALVFQATIGYTQYFSGVPVPLVALHIVGVVVVWALASNLAFASRKPVGEEDGRETQRSEATLTVA
jgi:cytochrome c oxidase assembly protein subunit 15